MNTRLANGMLGVLALHLLLGACTSIPEDRGAAAVSELVAERRGITSVTDGRDPEAHVAVLLDRPLTVDDAVQIALLNNPDLRVTYSRLGFAAADLYDAGRLSNPRLSVALLDSSAADERDQQTVGLTQSFTDLLLLGARSRFGKGEFERVQQTVAHAVLELASEVKSAYYRLVGARQAADVRALTAKAARTSADLAQRFFDAGNLPRRELAMEQAAASQARLEALSTEAEVTANRVALARLMGLHPQTHWSVAGRLSVPLVQDEELPELLALADASRLDLAAARREVELLSDSRDVARRYRWLGDVEVGIERERETDGTRLTGPTLELELPIFNQRAAGVLRADAQLERARGRLDVIERDVANGVALAHAQVLAGRQRAHEYRTALIPQREEIVARTQEQVNFMLLGQFELLLAKQAEYDAYQGYLESVRDYWLARVELGRAVGTQLPGDLSVTPPALEVEPLMRPAPTNGHGDHPMQREEPPSAAPEPHDHQPRDPGEPHFGEQP